MQGRRTGASSSVDVGHIILSVWQWRDWTTAQHQPLADSGVSKSVEGAFSAFAVLFGFEVDLVGFGELRDRVGGGRECVQHGEATVKSFKHRNEKRERLAASSTRRTEDVLAL